MDSGAARDAQLEARVREHLQPGETFRAAVWVSRADGRTSVGMTRAEMSPFRFRKPVAPITRPGLHGRVQSLAFGLDEHVSIVTDPRVLALSDRRLMVLSKRPGSWLGILRPGSGSVPALRVLWECRRDELASATEQGGRLRLAFTDGSDVTLLTPTAAVQPFLAG